MMTTFTQSVKYAFLLVIIFISHSCKKDTLIDISPGPGSGYASVKDFFVQHGNPMQTFSINPQITNIITGSQGTSFTVLPNTLLDSVNQPPSGNVTVQLIEIYTVKDMILSNKPTTSFGQILHSGGEIFIRFVANGISYYPAQGINITMPNTGVGPAIQNAEIFWGIPDTTPPGIAWVPDSSINITSDSSGNNYMYWLPNLNYNWINCDAFYASPPVTNVTVTTQVSGGNGETVDMYLFLVFKNINSVMAIYYLSSPNTYTAYDIPVGMEAVAVGIGVGRITKKSYFGKTSTTVSQSQTVPLTITQTTANQIKIELQNL